MRRIALVLFLMMVPGVAAAQSAPGRAQDYLPGVQEWHDVFAGKADVDTVARAIVSNAGVKVLLPGQFRSIVRQGFAAAGDGGAATYIWSSSRCSLNAGGGDNGAQIAPATGTGCWIIQPSLSTDIRVWGAKADDATDIGPSVQAAYDANVGCVFIPGGIWKWSSAVIMNKQPPCFQGLGWNENVLGGVKTGTWVHFTDPSVSPVTITAITGQGGVGGFSKMAFFADQPVPGPGWAPIEYPYPFTLHGNLGRVDFDDLMFWNTTHCISSTLSSREHVKNIYGQPLGTCLKFDQEHDILQVSSIEFWPFWSGDANVASYQQANVDPILFLRADSPTVDNIFGFSYHSTIAFGQSADGVTTGMQINSVQSDASKYGIWIKTGTSNVQFQASNVRGAGEAFPGTGAIAGSSTYKDDGVHTTADIANLDCFYAGSSCVSITGSGSLRYSNAQLWNYNQDNTNSAGIDAGTEGVVFGANQPGVVTPANNGPVIPMMSAGGKYAMHGVRQYWTPSIAATGTAGTVNYSSNVGTFWYDGSEARMNFYINVRSSSGMSGNLVIRGLPLTHNAAVNQNTYCTVATMSGVVLPPNYTMLTAVIPGGPGINQVVLTQSGNGQPTAPVPASVLGSAFVLEGSCTMAAGQ